ncbi:hypothetical protein V6N12_001396 [Hibiscus sabdariffa]|uniref:Uncharacterized protein n=1 Tax=Hibiscus sabdariffa TaxID=183260 RepID=A0ABR2ANC4_9ROSI
MTATKPTLRDKAYMSPMFSVDTCVPKEVGESVVVSRTHCSSHLKDTHHPDGFTTNTIPEVVALPAVVNEFVTNSNGSHFVERGVAIESSIGHESASLIVVPNVSLEHDANVEPSVGHESASHIILPNVIPGSHSPNLAVNKDLTTYLSNQLARSDEVNRAESSSSAHITSRYACVVSQPVQCGDVPRANTYME